jgi:carbon-monoxide dehydrogenase large subunit
VSLIVGSRVPRVEDPALVRGEGEFIADLTRDGLLEAVVVRSTEAHADIDRIDIEQAMKVDGVAAVFTAADLPPSAAALTRPFYQLTDEFIRHARVTLHPVREPVLAADRVRRVGEPLALVVGRDRFVVEDARDLVFVDLTGLPVVANPEQARQPDAVQIDPAVPGNLHGRFRVVVGDPMGAASTADHRVSASFRIGRAAGSPLENRGVVAEYDDSTDTLTVWSTTQVPHVLRSHLTSTLDLPETRIRVVAPDMGGSFGGGIYPEEVLVPWAAMQLRSPVRWLEERGEELVNSRHSRDQLIDAELAYQDDGTFVALRMTIVQDCGAANPFGITLPHNIASHARSMYAIPNFEAEGLAVLTNKTRNTPVRGAGRPEATFVIDRLVDMAANRLGLDPVELRRRNLIPAGDMPCDLGMLYRDGNPLVYDSGDYPDQLETALDAAGYERLRRLSQKAASEGKAVGVGVSCHVEATGLGPHETAHVAVDASGRIVVTSGSQPHGQSHHTVLAQVCADVFDVDMADIVVQTSDTALVATGGGTFGSRSAVTAGSAVRTAAESARDRVVELAAGVLEIAPDDLVLAGGRVGPRGVPGGELTLAELALAVQRERSPDADAAPGLEGWARFEPPAVTFGSGTHVAAVEVDIDTGFVRVIDYTIVADSGTLLNPMVVDGQQHGGAVHGIANMLLEEVLYDEAGQPMNTTFMDYLLPTAADVPSIKVVHRSHPSPLNAMGVKGAGEGATASAPAAVANAIVDALRPLGVEITEMPITPPRLRALIVAARESPAGQVAPDHAREARHTDRERRHG